MIIALLAAGPQLDWRIRGGGRDVGGTHDHTGRGQAMIRKLAVAGPDGGHETNRP